MFKYELGSHNVVYNERTISGLCDTDKALPTPPAELYVARFSLKLYLFTNL